MIGAFELSLEREPKTDKRRTANDGPLSIPYLSRIVPGVEGGRYAEGGEGGSLRSSGDEGERTSGLFASSAMVVLAV
jgi:hypothetical protein